MDWKKGDWISFPKQQRTDPHTEKSFWNLTHGEGNNRHIYFNRPNFTGDGHYVIFLSDRTGSWQIYAHDLYEERVRRLTDCASNPGRPGVDQYRPLLYFTQKNALHRLNIDTLEEDVIYTHPAEPDTEFLLLDVSEDGQYLGCMTFGPFDRTGDGPTDFVGRFEQRSYSTLQIITSDGAKAWQVHGEKRHLQHLLFCPTDPTTIMYCHEGPASRIDQRMWLIRWDGTKMRPLRYQEHPSITICHEFWMADGQHVAYAYACPVLGHPWSVRIFNVHTETETVLIEHRFSHFISNRNGTQLIGDDPEHVTLLDVKTQTLTPLVRHNQELTIANTHYHPHPAFNPAGDQAVFCMRDAEGHNDVCLISIDKP